MEIIVQLTDQAIPYPAAPFPSGEGGLGALAEFYGIIRPTEAGQPIGALRYEAYPGMAESELRRLAAEVGTAHPCQRVHILHRHGLIPVGESAVFIRAEASHRAEAFAFLDVFMRRLKQDVPIWKTEGVISLDAGEVPDFREDAAR
jgi:molybdopterin synthase catalytic subunit